MPCFLLLLYLFIVLNAELLTIKINDVKLKQTSTNASHLNGIAEYYFYDNELAEVSCSVSVTGMMRLEVQDEPRLELPWTNTNDIRISIRMRNTATKNYIDCYHNNSDVLSMVRIMLIQNVMDTNKDSGQIIINQKVLGKPIEYKYIHDEKINVTCKNNLLYGHFQSSEKEVVMEGYTPKNNANILECSRTLTFTEMNINGLQGLSSSNIIFLYKTSDYLAIHYEYDGVQTLNLEWQVTVIAGKSNEYKVFWKDSLVSLLPVMTTQNDCKLKLTINPIIISGEDDHSIINFTRIITGDSKPEHNETRIILRQIVHSIEADQKVDINIVYIAIGVCCILLIIILMSSTVIIIKNKLKSHRNITEENSYVNLDKESSLITPFPSQWETYASTMVRTEPDMNIIQQLYAKPLPKSQRIKPDETNTGSSDVDEVLYSEIQEFEPLGDAKSLTMDRKDKNSYINLKK